MAEPRETCFDDLWPGRTFPPYRYVLTEDLACRYAAIAGAEPATYPAVLASQGLPLVAPPLLLDTLQPLKALLAFPEGVVHAREEVEFRGLGRVGDQITVWLSVEDRYVRNERRFVRFVQRAENQRGETLLVARKTLVWPC